MQVTANARVEGGIELLLVAYYAEVSEALPTPELRDHMIVSFR